MCDVDMHSVTSFAGSAVGPDELSGIMADYLALERARIMRRLLVMRCGSLALAAAVIGLAFHWLSPFASWFSVGAFLTPPAWAWFVEIRRHVQLSRRLEDVPGAVTQVVSEDRTLS